MEDSLLIAPHRHRSAVCITMIALLLQFKEVLGKGAFKTVYKAQDLEHGNLVAWNEVNIKMCVPRAQLPISTGRGRGIHSRWLCYSRCFRCDVADNLAATLLYIYNVASRAISFAYGAGTSLSSGSASSMRLRY